MNSRVIALAVLLLAGCRDSITAPGVCPEFCPDSDLSTRDTVLTGVLALDSTYRGFRKSFRAQELQLISPGGGDFESRVLLRFAPFNERVLLGPADTVTVPVLGIDSFRIDLRLVKRRADVEEITVGVYRAPVDLDTLATFASSAPVFDAANLLGTIEVPDTATLQAISLRLDPDAFPTFADDDLTAAAGIRIDSPDPSWIIIGSNIGNASAVINRYYTIDSAGVTLHRSDARFAALDVSVQDVTIPAAAGELSVGGLPSARTILRATGLDEVLDRYFIARATLELIPSRAVIGAAGDSVIVQAGIAQPDFGRKSPLILGQLDSLYTLAALVPVGSTDTVRIDVTDIVRQWAADPETSRAVMLVAAPEGATPGELRFHPTTADVALRPSLRLTIIPPAGPAQP